MRRSEAPFYRRSESTLIDSHRLEFYLGSTLSGSMQISGMIPQIKGNTGTSHDQYVASSRSETVTARHIF